MKPKITIGVDDGLHGGISFFDTVSTELVGVYTMPTKKVNKHGKDKNVIDLDRLKFILEIPKEHKDTAILVMEDVSAYPGQGVVSVGSLLEQKGLVRGIA